MGPYVPFVLLLPIFHQEGLKKNLSSRKSSRAQPPDEMAFYAGSLSYLRKCHVVNETCVHKHQSAVSLLLVYGF